MNLNNLLNSIYKAPFTTREMEQSKTRCGADFEILKIYYDDNSHLPHRAIGIVTVDGHFKYKVTWDQYGECNIHGHRLLSFDLIRPYQNQLDSAMIVFVGSIGIVITLIIIMIWN